MKPNALNNDSFIFAIAHNKVSKSSHTGQEQICTQVDRSETFTVDKGVVILNYGQAKKGKKNFQTLAAKFIEYVLNFFLVFRGDDFIKIVRNILVKHKKFLLRYQTYLISLESFSPSLHQNLF